MGDRMPVSEHGHDERSLPLPERMRLLADQADEQHIIDWAAEVERLREEVRKAWDVVDGQRDTLQMQLAKVEGLREVVRDLLDCCGGPSCDRCQKVYNDARAKYAR